MRLRGFRPVITRAERDFKGLLADLVEALLIGVTVNEVDWEIRRFSNLSANGLEYMPRAARRIPALYYRYPFTLEQIDELLLNPSGELGGINNITRVEIYRSLSGNTSHRASAQC